MNNQGWRTICCFELEYFSLQKRGVRTPLGFYPKLSYFKLIKWNLMKDNPWNVPYESIYNRILLAYKHQFVIINLSSVWDLKLKGFNTTKVTHVLSCHAQLKGNMQNWMFWMMVYSRIRSKLCFYRFIPTFTTSPNRLANGFSQRLALQRQVCLKFFFNLENASLFFVTMTMSST